MMDPYFTGMFCLLASFFLGNPPSTAWKYCAVLGSTKQLSGSCIEEFLSTIYFVQFMSWMALGFLSGFVQFPSWRQAISWVCAVMEPKLIAELISTILESRAHCWVALCNSWERGLPPSRTAQFAKVVQERDATKSRGVSLWLDSNASRRTQAIKWKINSNKKHKYLSRARQYANI